MPLLNVAGFDFYVECEELTSPVFHNYHPFIVENRNEQPLLFRMVFGELQEVELEAGSCFKTNNGTYSVVAVDDFFQIVFQGKRAGCRFRLQAKRDWSYVVTDVDCRITDCSQILNEFILLVFVYGAAFRDTVLIHASCIRRGGEGVAFTGPSGIGKSTHSRLWLQYIPESDLLNDDQPAVRLINGGPYMYGTPWSGKTDCYKNERVRLSALFRLEQALENKVDRLSPVMAYANMLSSTSMMKDDKTTFDCITKTLATIAGQVKSFHLRSRPEKEAAELSFAYSFGINENKEENI